MAAVRWKSSSPVVRLLGELIALPSVNPAFLPGVERLTGETRVADFLAATAASAGLAVDFQEVRPGRRNVLIRYLPPERATRSILLAPHMDTVGTQDGDERVFRPELREGRVWGRGACDTKGSIAAMLQALMETVRGGRAPRRTEIVLAALVDEECHQWGSRALAESGFRADLGIVGEPTRLRVVSAHKGDVWVRLATRGRSAHGARPELGRNAVLAMARGVDLLENGYAAELRKRPGHPLLGRPTVNVGRIYGGTQPNIVPDRCVIEVDRRTLPGETAEGVKREMVAYLRRHGVRVTLEDMKGLPAPALETDPGLPRVRELLRAARRRSTEGVVYFCDAAVLAMGGTPCVVFGPGDIAQAHTADEWVSVESLEGARGVLGRFLESQP